MSTQYLSMAQARELIEPEAFAEFCLQLEEFAAKRGFGLSVADTAAAIGITRERGERFEIAISTLLAVLKTSEAAPATTEAARPNPERNHSS